MTKKHYTAIADIVKAMRTYMPETGRKMLARLLADYFATDNPKFNRDMFLTACGIEAS